MAFQGTDRFKLFLGEGKQPAELTDRTDGVLGLPTPIVPLVLRDVAPERMAPRLTGRFFFVVAATGRMDRGLEPGTLV